MTNSSRRDPRSRTSDRATIQFIESLADLRGHASQVIKLGGKRIRTVLDELDDGTGDLPRRVLFLMNDIEENFRSIRLKLGE
jgi:hypothetical protein